MEKTWKPYDDGSGLTLTPHEVFRGRKLINPSWRSVLETSEAWPKLFFDPKTPRTNPSLVGLETLSSQALDEAKFTHRRYTTA